MGWALHNRPDKNGKHSVIYQVYYGGGVFPVMTGVKTKKVKKFTGKVKDDIKATLKLKAIESIIITSLSKAKDQLPYWSKDQLKTHISFLMQGGTVENGNLRIDLYQLWLNQIERYRKANKFESVKHNEHSMKMVFAVLDKDLFIDELSKKHLQLIVDGLQHNRSTSTINGFLRDLRAVVNQALQDEIIQVNPFFKFKLPKMRTKVNVALELEELSALINAPTKTDYQRLILDMGYFMYLCCGMRVRDCVLLKPENIRNASLSYTTKKNTKDFDYPLLDDAIQIVEKYKGGKYVFPILTKDLAPEELSKFMALFRRSMRQVLVKLGNRVGIKKKLSPHVFRHTYNFINDHFTLKERQKMLGHSIQRTTENYDSTMPQLNTLVKQIKTIPYRPYQ